LAKNLHSILNIGSLHFNYPVLILQCAGELKLKEMEALYLAELAVASAAAKGLHVPKAGEGDHRPPK
jgi:hypothetical protein